MSYQKQGFYDGQVLMASHLEAMEEGILGAEGKSAYDYAVAGGYTGTESEFAEKMANGLPKVGTEVILPESTLPIGGIQWYGNTYWGFASAAPLVLVQDSTYIVNFNGTKYTCVATNNGAETGEVPVYIGNNIFAGGAFQSGGCPFVMFLKERRFYLLVKNETAQVTVSISVPTEDDGKLLQVVDGKWAAVPADAAGLGAAGQPAYFITTYTTEDGQTYTADHTFAQQMAAFQNGRIPYALLDGIYIPVLFGDSNAIQYGITMAMDNGVMMGMILHTADDTVEFSMSLQPILTEENVNTLIDEKGGSGLPAVTATDNGKILQVVDGAWSVLAVADSAVATYVDDYINSALGGDY